MDQTDYVSIRTRFTAKNIVSLKRDINLTGNSARRTASSFVTEKAMVKAQKAKEVKEKLLSGAKTIVLGPFNWFGKLPAITQASLLFLLIIYFSPKLAESILTVIKALK